MAEPGGLTLSSTSAQARLGDRDRHQLGLALPAQQPYRRHRFLIQCHLNIMSQTANNA